MTKKNKGEKVSEKRDRNRQDEMTNEQRESEKEGKKGWKYKRKERLQKDGKKTRDWSYEEDLFFLSSASCKGTNECKHEFRILKLKCIRRVLAHKWHDSSAPNSRIWNRVAVQIIRFDPLKRGIWYYKSVEVFNICLYF